MLSAQPSLQNRGSTEAPLHIPIDWVPNSFAPYDRVEFGGIGFRVPGVPVALSLSLGVLHRGPNHYLFWPGFAAEGVVVVPPLFVSFPYFFASWPSGDIFHRGAFFCVLPLLGPAATDVILPTFGANFWNA